MDHDDMDGSWQIVTETELEKAVARNEEEDKLGMVYLLDNGTMNSQRHYCIG